MAKPRSVAYLISRFGEFEGQITSEAAQTELVARGAAAVPGLIRTLDHRERGWQAAMTLSEIGAPAANRAIPALLRHARDPRSASAMWSACALGRLGRIAELFELAPHAAFHFVAVMGLVAARPASYPQLEALLARKTKALTKTIETALSPGSASYRVSPADVDAIMLAAASPHITIRKDATIALGGMVGVANRPRTVALLADLLDDRSSEVRRLAALSLGRSRGHARPVLPRLKRAAREDRVAAVRATATHAIREI